jgi:hypothetical protein
MQTDTLPTVSRDPSVQQHYERCRAEGTSHSLALMFALAQPPMSNTDREFLEGHCNGSQFGGSPAMGDAYKSIATSAGVDVTGKVYLSGLAEYPGDPRAWVSGRGDVAKVCEERGWNCQGSVNVKAARNDAPAGVPGGVADDILENEVEAVLATSERPEKEDRAGIKEQIRQKRKPHWSK